MEPTIIYEDEKLFAVNKPAGLLVHPERGGSETPTLVGWIRKRYPALENVGEPLTLSDGTVIKRPGIVHRLDKDTSGVLVVAKTQNAYEYLKKQFQERKIEKEYRAIVYGRIKNKEGVICAAILRDPKDYRRRSVAQEGQEGRDAFTSYRTLAAADDYSYLALFPKTGRTHQIRVHMKSIHYPIVCDPLYAPKRECPSELGRLALHAFALSFTHPDSFCMRLEAPIPKEFEQFVSKLQDGE